MIFKVKPYFASDSLSVFPKEGMSVWISENDKIKLFGDVKEDSRPYYVRIESKELLSRFTMYARLGTINPRIEMGHGILWIPKEIMHRSHIVEKDTEAEVTLVDDDDIAVAESVAIKLDSGKVANWSEEEVTNAERNFRNHVFMTFLHQMVIVRPKTKSSTLGEVTSIYPHTNDKNSPFIVNENTKIIFEGLPAIKQKVIDFSQIGGLNNVIEQLREIIQIPLSYPEYLTKFNIKQPKGMLMYGPPGNGKTMIARAVAQSMGSAFITIEGPELMSKYVGVGEQRLREKFEEAETKGNCVIFIDEIDSIASTRDDSGAEYQVSIVATLLNLMDGMKSSNHVFVIGATNRLNAIDPALRRPGRFDLEFEVPLPGLSAREDIISKYVKLDSKDNYDDSIKSNTLSLLAELTNGYSGADISLLYREACMNAIRKHMAYDTITGKIEAKKKVDDVRVGYTDFMKAIKTIVPTSLRGVDIEHNGLTWDEIVGMKTVKKTLEELHTQICMLLNSENLMKRPSMASFLISGKPGTGKRTLIHSFAQKFGYETLELNLLEMSSLSPSETNKAIENIFMKGKQISPCVLILRNFEDRNYLNKIMHETNKIGKHVHLLVVGLTESTTAESLLGYGKFGLHLNIDITKEEKEQCIKTLYGKSAEPLDYDSKTLGQLIIEHSEKEILRNVI